MDLKENATKSYTLRVNYSQSKTLTIGECINSSPFKVGAHDWVIKYYPNGHDTTYNNGQWLSFFLQILTDSTVVVKARFCLTLLNPIKKHKSTGNDAILYPSIGTKQGFERYIKIKEMQKFDLKDGTFEIDVKVCVLDGAMCGVDIFPFDLPTQISNLLEKRGDTDISFEVRGQVFHAHKLILSARSPVFKAQFSGPMVEARSGHMQIREMNPSVFESLLNFLYTDNLSNMPNDSNSVMNLLIAADKYHVQGMVLMCEHLLCELITQDNVFKILKFAVDYNSTKVKTACLDFIVKPEHFMQLAITEDYFSIFPDHPFLVKELQEARKKQRIG